MAVSSAEEEIKRKYRALQRKHHPDIAGEQSREISAKLNLAYDVLTNRKARLEYDGQFKKAGFVSSNTVQSVDGLVGPMRERAVPVSVRAFLPICGCLCAGTLLIGQRL